MTICAAGELDDDAAASVDSAARPVLVDEADGEGGDALLEATQREANLVLDVCGEGFGDLDVRMPDLNFHGSSILDAQARVVSGLWRCQGGWES